MSPNSLLTAAVGFAQGYVGYMFIVGLLAPFTRHILQGDNESLTITRFITNIFCLIVLISAFLGLGWTWVTMLSAYDPSQRGWYFKIWVGSGFAGFLSFIVLPRLEEIIRGRIGTKKH